jgi:hypothetical protein
MAGSCGERQVGERLPGLCGPTRQLLHARGERAEACRQAQLKE